MWCFLLVAAPASTAAPCKYVSLVASRSEATDCVAPRHWREVVTRPPRKRKSVVEDLPALLHHTCARYLFYIVSFCLGSFRWSVSWLITYEDDVPLITTRLVRVDPMSYMNLPSSWARTLFTMSTAQAKNLGVSLILRARALPRDPLSLMPTEYHRGGNLASRPRWMNAASIATARVGGQLSWLSSRRKCLPSRVFLSPSHHCCICIGRQEFVEALTGTGLFGVMSEVCSPCAGLLHLKRSSVSPAGLGVAGGAFQPTALSTIIFLV